MHGHRLDRVRTLSGARARASTPSTSYQVIPGSMGPKPYRKLFGQIIVRHMCATGDPSKPSPSAGCRK